MIDIAFPIDFTYQVNRDSRAVPRSDNGVNARARNGASSPDTWNVRAPLRVHLDNGLNPRFGGRFCRDTDGLRQICPETCRKDNVSGLERSVLRLHCECIAIFLNINHFAPDEFCTSLSRLTLPYLD